MIGAVYATSFDISVSQEPCCTSHTSLQGIRRDFVILVVLVMSSGHSPSSVITMDFSKRVRFLSLSRIGVFDMFGLPTALKG